MVLRYYRLLVTTVVFLHALPSFAQVAPCVADATTLCLNQGRFEVKTRWADPQGSSGDGQAVSLTNDTGYFWFFSSDNVEVVIKVLDGCTITEHLWVFAGGLTNVEVQITVTDTATGALSSYHNPLNQPFQPVQDTMAFATCDTAGPGSEPLSRIDAAEEAVKLESLVRRLAAEDTGTPASGASRLTGSPQGTTYDVIPVLGADPDGDGQFQLLSLGSGTRDNVVTFDGEEEMIDTFVGPVPITPLVTESFLERADGTMRLTLDVSSVAGRELYPGNVVVGSSRYDAGIFVGAVDPLDWQPPHLVRTARMDLSVGATPLFSADLSGQGFFDEPNGWDGTLGIVFQGAGAMGVNRVHIEMELEELSAMGNAPAAPTDLSATALSQSQIQLQWNDNSNNENNFRIEQRVAGSFQEVATTPAGTTSTVLGGLDSGTAYTFRVRARNQNGNSPYSNEATATTFAEPGSCTPAPDVLCLNAGRFQVSVDWRTAVDGGVGQGVELTNDTGYFWFFNPDNVEMIVKVLNACDAFNRFWVFAGGLTNVEVDITVEDTGTGAIRTYQNPLETPFQPILDTSAFATCP